MCPQPDTVYWVLVGIAGTLGVIACGLVLYTLWDTGREMKHWTHD